MYIKQAGSNGSYLAVEGSKLRVACSCSSLLWQHHLTDRPWLHNLGCSEAGPHLRGVLSIGVCRSDWSKARLALRPWSLLKGRARPAEGSLCLSLTCNIQIYSGSQILNEPFKWQRINVIGYMLTLSHRHADEM